MAGNRKQVEDFCLSVINGIDPTGINAKIYQDKVFGPMDDKAFAKFMDDLKNKKRHLVLYVPNYGPVKLDLNRNLELGKKLGRNFYERVWFLNRKDLPDQLSPVPVFVLPTLNRRQAQLVTKGVSVPKDMKTINPLTGQPTGESQSAKVSMIEAQLCSAVGTISPMIELFKYRGGDTKGGAALSGMLVNTGRASLKALAPYAGGVEYTNYIRALFNAAHLRINL
jgi:hypothetical protein